MGVAHRFVFHGHACAYSGRLYRPEDITIPSPASSVLPVTGGRSDAAGKRQRFAPYLSVGPSSTSAQGLFGDRRQAVAMTHERVREDALVASTTASADVSDVAADSRRFLVRSIKAGLVATSPPGPGQPPIRLTRQTAIRGVSIDGYELSVVLDLRRFEQADTFDALARTTVLATGPVFERHEDLIYTTIVRELKWAKKAHPAAILEGHCLHVPGFGRVFFGEMTVERSARRVTMMRLRLGSPIALHAGFADVGANGSWYPPTS